MTSFDASATGIGNLIIQISGSHNNVTVGAIPTLKLFALHRLRETKDSPASILLPNRRNTKFIGRDHELASLKSWLDADTKISVRTLTGQPGIGKTRIAIELADLVEAQGWDVGFLRGSQLQRFVAQPNLSEWQWSRSVLVIVDYASQKANALRTWVEDLQDRDETVTSSKLRLLLLDRDGSAESGWWERVFGSNGQWSDRRRELCDPRFPVQINQLPHESDALRILQDAAGAKEMPADAARSILEKITAGQDAAQILGNPLLLQIAAADPVASGAGLSRGLLLQTVADMELSRMKNEWASVGAPQAIWSDLEDLVSVITLLRGATTDEVLDLLPTLTQFTRLRQLLETSKIIDCLSRVLRWDVSRGFSGVEPDLIGDTIIIRRNFSDKTIAELFAAKASAVASRLWHIFSEFEGDTAFSDRSKHWIRVAIDACGNDTLSLDAIVRNAPHLSASVAELISGALARITAGLREGGKTLERLLLRKDQQAMLVPRSLYREAFVLKKLNEPGQALVKLAEVETSLSEAKLDLHDFFWLDIHTLRVDCFDLLQESVKSVSAIDRAIEFCTRNIAAGHLRKSNAFASDPLRGLVEGLAANGFSTLSPNGLKTVSTFSDLKDVRLKLADLVLRRWVKAGVSQEMVEKSILELDRLMKDRVYIRFSEDAEIYARVSARSDDPKTKEYAEVCARIRNEILHAGKEFINTWTFHMLKLRNVMLLLSEERGTEIRKKHACGAVAAYYDAIGIGVTPDVMHLTELGITFYLTYSEITGCPLSEAEATWLQAGIKFRTDDSPIEITALRGVISSLAEQFRAVGPC
jgi:hypothetical protein